MTAGARPLRLAVVGAGPAGIHAAGALAAAERGLTIDLLEQLPAPYGLIRYGVAPDHQRIKGIVSALDRVLALPSVRLLGNVTYGRDVRLADLRACYDAVVFATGADRDRDLDVPGADARGSHGGADFVRWYNGHPDASATWPLDTPAVGVLGVGNVALDIARVLARPADEMVGTDVPDTVLAGLRASRVRDVHVFGRRGPAQASFSALELRELDHADSIRVVVDPADLEYDTASVAARAGSRQVDAVCTYLEGWASTSAADRRRTIHLHFLENPAAIRVDGGRVAGLRTERMRLDGTGRAVGTGVLRTWPVSAVYRAIGYRSAAVPELPFDPATHTVPNLAGRVVDGAGVVVPGVYVTGWVKRGAVGLIGHTKNDAQETVTSLLADYGSGRVDGSSPEALGDRPSITDLLTDRRVAFTTLRSWQRLDEVERSLGTPSGRDRVKIAGRTAMLAAALSTGQYAPE